MTFGNSEMEEQGSNPGESAPQYITEWIWSKCETPTPKNPKTKSCQGTSFFYGLKMQAAISY